MRILATSTHPTPRVPSSRASTFARAPPMAPARRAEDDALSQVETDSGVFVAGRPQSARFFFLRVRSAVGRLARNAYQVVFERESYRKRQRPGGQVGLD